MKLTGDGAHIQAVTERHKIENKKSALDGASAKRKKSVSKV